MSEIAVDVFSDLICPWCYVGKRRLEAARAALGDTATLNVTWRPFQLNPGMPAEGMPRERYLEAKFGSRESASGIYARVRQAGEEAGIDFRFDRIARVPNSFNGHRLLWWARDSGAQDALAEALFQAYFIEGRDVGHTEVLAECAAEAGLDRGAALAFLDTDAGVAEVREEEGEGRTLGIGGVPHFVFNGKAAVYGAQEVDTFLDAIRRAP